MRSTKAGHIKDMGLERGCTSRYPASDDGTAPPSPPHPQAYHGVGIHPPPASLPRADHLTPRGVGTQSHKGRQNTCDKRLLCGQRMPLLPTQPCWARGPFWPMFC